MELELYNSLGRETKRFVPLDRGKAGMYACGPTVYNYAHIGNLRTYLSEDILRRVLEYMDFQVEHVMNVTDVGHLTDDADQGEDKMLKSARESGRNVWDIAEHYARSFFDDIDSLNISRPTIVCKATDHIQDMIELIRRIEKNGYTYIAGGNVYFDIFRFSNYGELAGLNLDDLKAGARIEVDGNKKNPLDFVLWFTRSKFSRQSMLWDSPWGRGYPGWHIECSAMSMKYLGDHFDIHCGGIDHVPVHHTNEIAQSEAATNKKWVNYWFHSEFLLMSSEKMAKSTGNFITVSELRKKGYHPLDFRYLCLQAHYRSQLRFNFRALDAARIARLNLIDRLSRLKTEWDGDNLGDEPDENKYIESFHKNILADLNIPRCLADLWGIMKDESIPPGPKIEAVRTMDRILGLDLDVADNTEIHLSDELKKMIQEREIARREKDYVKADAIRLQLKDMGILLEDTQAGVRTKVDARLSPVKKVKKSL